ncbi:MAG TPA: flagellar biosynthetic protein FliO [Candidatus Baltobacteraceae bacterium]|nr:flagellar biosynthetic protein FliO [Candidatus Baltobacteraceae bacterium]
MKARILVLALGLTVLSSVTAAAPGSPATAPVTMAAPAPASVSDRAAVPEYRLAESGSDRSLLWDGTRAAASFGIVLVLLAVGVKALRRWPGLTGRPAAAGPLQVLGRLPLSAKDSVCLIRVGKDALVVGVSGAGITLLHRLEAGAAGESDPVGVLAAGAAARPTAGRFRALAARIQDVQAAWGFGGANQKGTS